MSEASKLPDTLPTDAKGFTKRLIIHMNFGEDGGAAKYSVHGPDGVDMPITHQYDTRTGGVTGFHISGVDQTFEKWADLAAYWPTYMAEQSA